MNRFRTQAHGVSFRQGFTLIELLVVIAIIVVLLALLVPALDKALYQSELAVCATHLNAITTGANTYALNFKRSYPYRPGVVAGGNYYPYQLSDGGIKDSGRPGNDDRKMLRDYMRMCGPTPAIRSGTDGGTKGLRG